MFYLESYLFLKFGELDFLAQKFEKSLKAPMINKENGFDF